MQSGDDQVFSWDGIKGERVMYKLSKFIISQSLNEGTQLLYHTFTTSLIELEIDLYRKIFEEKDFTINNEIIQALLDMGFLVNEDVDENEELEEYRRTVIESNSGKIADIVIAPTMECNAHCSYCFENGVRHGCMTETVALQLAKYLRDHWNGEKLGITWFGGEPLMAPNIIDAITNKLEEYGVSFHSKITTNGSLLTPKILEKAKNTWNVKKIQVTIDGVGDEYNRVKNYSPGEFDNPFETVIQNVQNALDMGISVRIRINFDPQKCEASMQTMSFIKKRFADYQNITIYFAPIDAESTQVKCIATEFDGMEEHPFIKMIRFGREHGYYKGFPDVSEKNLAFDKYGLLKNLKLYPSPTNCYASCPSVYAIDAKGDIYKCHRMLGRGNKYTCGNINTGVIKNEVYDTFCNTKVSYEECNNCSVLPICQGGCIANAIQYKDEHACTPIKPIIKDLVLLYKQDLEACL